MPPFFGVFPRSGLWWVSLMREVLFPCLCPVRLFQWLLLMQHICRPHPARPSASSPAPRGRGQSWRYPRESRIRGGDIYATFFRHLPIHPTQWIGWVLPLWGVLFPCLYPCKAFPVAPVNAAYLSPPPQGAGAVMAISPRKPYPRRRHICHLFSASSHAVDCGGYR